MGQVPSIGADDEEAPAPPASRPDLPDSSILATAARRFRGEAAFGAAEAAPSSAPTIASVAGVITSVGLGGGITGMIVTSTVPLGVDWRGPFALSAFYGLMALLTWLREATARWIYGVLLLTIVSLTVTIPLIPEWPLLPMCYVIPLATTAQFASRRRLAFTVGLALAGYALATALGPHPPGHSTALDAAIFVIATVGTVTIIRRMQRALNGSFAQLDRLATYDALTGALNRRAFEARLDPWLGHGADGRAACLLLIDVDHFKAVNDTHGHAAGDAVLQELTRIAREALRPGDELGRVGGEEFAVLLPDTRPGAAAAVAELLRRAVERESPARGIGITVSLGVADCATADGAWVVADAALYAAKRGGRNRVEMGGVEPPRRVAA